MQKKILFLFRQYHSHFDIINGTVTTGSSRTLNHLHDIKTLLYLTEYGVLTIEVRRTTDGGVNL